jgi:hypothetical protein
MRYSSTYSYNSVQDAAEKLFLWVGAAFLLIGFMGLFLIIMYPKMYGSDQVMQFASTFMNSYLTVFGIFLVIYHSKILVKGRRT